MRQDLSFYLCFRQTISLHGPGLLSQHCCCKYNLIRKTKTGIKKRKEKNCLFSFLFSLSLYVFFFSSFIIFWGMVSQFPSCPGIHIIDQVIFLVTFCFCSCYLSVNPHFFSLSLSLSLSLSFIYLFVCLFVMYRIFCLCGRLQTKRGNQTSLQIVVSHHVVPGNWTQDLWAISPSPLILFIFCLVLCFALQDRVSLLLWRLFLKLALFLNTRLA